MNPLAVLLAVAACGAAAYAITSVLVAGLDLLGLVYSPKREERAHASDRPAFNPAARRRFER